MENVLGYAIEESVDLTLEQSEEVNGEMGYLLTDNDKEYIRNYVAEATTDEEKKERRRECATVFNLRLPQVAAITAHTVIRAKKAAAAPPAPPLPSIALPVVTPAGSVMDYDNPIKQKYRTTFMDFLEKNTPADDRPDMKVLCFPGRKCLEIPIYLELGFRPENIVGVESEPTIFKEFLTNAAKYGISVRTTDALNMVDEMEWDVVNLDFTGPLSGDVLQILSYLSMSVKNRSILGINLLAGRESKDSQKIVDEFYAAHHFGKEMLKNKDKNSRNFIEVLELVDEMKEKHKTSMHEIEEIKLKEKREFAIHSAVINRLGYYIAPTKRTCAEPDLPPEFKNNETIAVLMSVFLQCLWRSLTHKYRMPEDYAVEITHKLMETYKMALAPAHNATSCQQVNYVSPSKQRFLAAFYTIEFCRPYGAACDEVIRFVNDSIVSLADIGSSRHETIDEIKDVVDGKNNLDKLEAMMKKGWSFQIRSKKGYIREAKYHPALSDAIEMTRDGRVVSHLEFKQLLNTFSKVAELINKDICVRMIRGEYEPGTIYL
jgi:hypothetical protein